MGNCKWANFFKHLENKKLFANIFSNFKHHFLVRRIFISEFGSEAFIAKIIFWCSQPHCFMSHQKTFKKIFFSFFAEIMQTMHSLFSVFVLQQKHTRICSFIMNKHPETESALYYKWRQIILKLIRFLIQYRTEVLGLIGIEVNPTSCISSY